MNQNMQLNDQDRLNDLLSQEKTLIGGYATNLCEASCQNLRGVLQQNMQATAQDQYQVFDQMRQRNWYPIEQVPPDKVQTAKQQMGQMKQQFS